MDHHLNFCHHVVCDPLIRVWWIGADIPPSQQKLHSVSVRRYMIKGVSNTHLYVSSRGNNSLELVAYIFAWSPCPASDGIFSPRAFAFP
uniref:Uncharacterized protein n=1 Tax=Triticum urartu TaxID=4572 RepID=A0A8R7PDS3_TRIUA